jgi:hypothetical protein
MFDRFLALYQLSYRQTYKRYVGLEPTTFSMARRHATDYASIAFAGLSRLSGGFARRVLAEVTPTP